eukprot:SAG22_NODE_222_length_14768_cov_6.358920_8_plen_272_part_00
MARLFCAGLLALPLAAGHGAMTFPRPRNALDGDLAQWKNWSYPCADLGPRHAGTGLACEVTFCCGGKECQGSCAVSAHDNKDPTALNGSNGQACYYFSNGCTVGCDECDGSVNHHGRGGQHFLYKGMDQATIRSKKFVIPDPFNPPPGEMVMSNDSHGAPPPPLRTACRCTACNPTRHRSPPRFPCPWPHQTHTHTACAVLVSIAQPWPRPTLDLASAQPSCRSSPAALRRTARSPPSARAACGPSTPRPSVAPPTTSTTGRLGVRPARLP